MSPPCSGHRINSTARFDRGRNRGLFDRLVGTGEQRGRHGKPKRFRCPEIDDEFVPGRRLNWQLGRPFAFQDAVDITGGTPVLVEEVRTIRDQATGGDEGPLEIDRRQLVACRKCDDQIAMNKSQGAGCYDHTACGKLAKAATARSISASSRTLIVRTSKPS